MTRRKSIMGCIDETFLNRIQEAKEATSNEDIQTTEAIIQEDKPAKKAKTIEQKKMLLRTDPAAQKKILKSRVLLLCGNCQSCEVSYKYSKSSLD